MKQKRRRLRKKEYERLQRERTERDSRARSQSENRQARIKVLWALKDEHPPGESFKERKLKEQKAKEEKLKELLRSVNLTKNDDLIDRVHEVVELAGIQDREIEYLAQFRRNWERIHAHDPEQLETLSSASVLAELQPLIEKQLVEEKPKEAWEHKRNRYKWRGGVGLIEYEFGGAGEAGWRKPLSAMCGLPYEPICLDDVFAGDRVNMRRLQELFGMNDVRFPKKLSPFKKGTQRLYDHQAVVAIMDALLSEESSDRAKSARGRPRQLWLSGTALRARVLHEIETRLKNLSAPEHIQAAFLAVVRHYLPDSAKK